MTATAATDKDLVGEILAGRCEAFSVLVERYLQSALAIARARLLNPADADDAVQEAFLRAYQGLHSLREPAKFGPWLLTIARHEAVRLVVKGRSTVGADPEKAVETITEPTYDRRELHAILRDHVSKLPEQAREVLLLHYFAGRSTREIAALLEIRQGAVLKRLQRAREHLAGTMLSELEATRPSSNSTAKQVARITALASAIAIPKTAAVAAPSTSALVFLPKTAAIVAGIIGAAAVAGIVVTTTWSSHHRQTLAQRDASSDPVQGGVVMAFQRTDNPQPSSSRSTQDLSASPTTPPANRATALDLTRPLAGKFVGAHVAEVLATLEEMSGTAIFIDQRAVGAPAQSIPASVIPVHTRPFASDGKVDSADFQASSALEAIDRVTASIGLKAVVAPGYVFISTPAQIRADGYAYTAAQYANYPEWDTPVRVTFRFGKTHIAEILQFTNEIYAKNIVMDSRVIAPMGLPSTGVPVFTGRKCTDGKIWYISLKDVRLEDALRVLARLGNLSVVVREDYFWISSPQMIRHDQLLRLPPEKRANIDKFAASPITVAFEDVHLNEILNFVHEIYEVSVVLDQRVVAWKNEPLAGIPLTNPHKPSSEVSPGLLQWVTLKNVSLQSALDILTRNLDLAYEVRGDRVIISTAKLLASNSDLAQNLVPAKEFAQQIAQLMYSGESEAPAGEQHAPVLTAMLQTPKGNRVKIDTGLSNEWYSQGDRVGDFTLKNISNGATCVTLWNDSTQAELKLCNKPNR